MKIQAMPPSSLPTRSLRVTQVFVLAAVVALALLQRRMVMANSDVSWLLTLAEKWLAGTRLYVDILEINPPFAIWMSALPVLLARLVGARVELVLDALILVLAAACVWLSWRLIRHWLDACSRLWLPVAAFAVLALLPAACFAEREHIALILFMPSLALALRRVEGGAVNVAVAILVGLGAGCVICIKPHFVLALGAIGVTTAAFVRSWRLLFAPEHFVAGAVLCVYAASVFLLYPTFWTDMVPLVALLYLPARVSPLDMLHGGFPLLILGLAIAGWLLAAKAPRALLAPRAALMLVAIIGFLGAALIQGKGWPYHFYPALALIVLLFVGTGLAKASVQRVRNTPVLLAFVCSGLFSAQFWLWFNSGLDMRVLQEPLRAIGKNPRILAIASDFAVAFPAVRVVEGEWVGRSIGHWVPYFVAGLSAQPNFDRALLPAYRRAEDNDRRELTQEILLGRPDALIIERQPFDYLAWVNRDSETAAMLTCYRAVGRYRSGASDAAVSAGVEVELYAADGRAPSSAGCAPR